MSTPYATRRTQPARLDSPAAVLSAAAAERGCPDYAGHLRACDGRQLGIGEATALALAQQGASVALVARRRERLESVAGQCRWSGGQATVIESDVTVAGAGDRRRRAGGGSSSAAGHRRQRRRNDAARSRPRRAHAGVGPDSRCRRAGAAVRHARSAAASAEGSRPAAAAGRRHRRRLFGSLGIWRAAEVASTTRRSGVLNTFGGSLRQEVTERHVHVALIEPGAVASELRATEPESGVDPGTGSRASNACRPRTSPKRSRSSSRVRDAPPSTRS